MSDDYIVLNSYGFYWMGNGWTERAEVAKDLCIEDAAALAVKHAPSQVLRGNAAVLDVCHDIRGRIVLESENGTCLRCESNAEAIATVVSMTQEVGAVTKGGCDE